TFAARGFDLLLCLAFGLDGLLAAAFGGVQTFADTFASLIQHLEDGLIDKQLQDNEEEREVDQLDDQNRYVDTEIRDSQEDHHALPPLAMSRSGRLSRRRSPP